MNLSLCASVLCQSSGASILGVGGSRPPDFGQGVVDGS